MSIEDQAPVIVGLGEILWDLLPSGRKLGGAPANFAYHAQVQGAESYIVSRIGDDDLGEEILEKLKTLGLNSCHIQRDIDHPTGTVSVELDSMGTPRYTIHENVAWDYIGFTQSLFKLAQQSDAVCFGSLAQRNDVSRETILCFLRSTRPECLRVFDINLRQGYFDRRIVQESLEIASVLKLNDEELPRVGQILSLDIQEERIIEHLIEHYPLHVIALTKGKNGCYLESRNGKAEHAGFLPQKVVDTVGAGDAFTAALTIGLLMNRPLETICEQANRLASYVCSQEGAMPPIPENLRQN